jgi:hypothetical protein
MNSSLLQSQSFEQLEENSLLSHLFFNSNNNSLFESEDNDNDSLFFLKNEKSKEEDSSYKKNLLTIEQKNYIANNNIDDYSSFEYNNSDQEKKIATMENFKPIGNMSDSTSGLFSPMSLLTTSNSNILNNSFNTNNIGVKKDEFIFESQNEEGVIDINMNNINNINNINTQNENINDGEFKCDFLEKIALGLDVDDNNFYYNNKKNKVNLNDHTSIFAAIINLMKEKGPIEIKNIVACLEEKKDTFRKTNGSRYKLEFGKLVRTTLNTPEIFYKTEEGNKYFFFEDKNAYYLQKKRERGMNKIFKLKKKNTFLPINVKIQLDKVNSIIKKMEKKYKADKKYNDVMICINMFKSLIDKYLYLIKMNKVNTVYELTVLNEKIIDICHTLEKIEKGDLFPKTIENIINKKVNKYNDQNNKNIMFVAGENNHFNEPPNNI